MRAKRGWECRLFGGLAVLGACFLLAWPSWLIGGFAGALIVAGIDLLYSGYRKLNKE